MGRCRNSVLLMVLSWLPLQAWRRGNGRMRRVMRAGLLQPMHQLPQIHTRGLGQIKNTTCTVLHTKRSLQGAIPSSSVPLFPPCPSRLPLGCRHAQQHADDGGIVLLGQVAVQVGGRQAAAGDRVGDRRCWASGGLWLNDASSCFKWQESQSAQVSGQHAARVVVLPT